ncbi:hypothetical protein BpHYR1_038022 [Brachionus plicatilis]|uniref:Uncharacterized protein n=1 Tax=Brachionus plicatilis TaxID=10195 RepID=A0A3M7QQP1_BRAPC|nr:hypothetical protein BpHYR1_038022 [Brachionus plicatilis]
MILFEEDKFKLSKNNSYHQSGKQSLKVNRTTFKEFSAIYLWSPSLLLGKSRQLETNLKSTLRYPNYDFKLNK